MGNDADRIKLNLVYYAETSDQLIQREELKSYTSEGLSNS